MIEEVEISTLDLRFESCRLRHPSHEARLLLLITEQGIQEPLEGVDTAEGRLLLNGFKRLRCARKLGLTTVPYVCLGSDEAMGVIELLRSSNNRTLNILEQAGFIDLLYHRHHLCLAEIADLLSRSKSWVSMRLGLIGQMSPRVRQKLFRGAFPVYAYMYVLRQFMRMNEVPKSEIEEFVVSVSGHALSVRDIEYLAHGFFRGPESFREQIRAGNITLSLKQIQEVPEDPQGCTPLERALLHDLEILQKYMQRVMGKSQNPRWKSQTFCVQANLLSGGILRRAAAFFEMMRQFHDRTGQAKSRL